MVNFESQKEENDRKINQWEFQQLHKISVSDEFKIFMISLYLYDSNSVFDFCWWNQDVQRLEKEKKKKEIASFLEANEGVVSHSVPKSKSTIHVSNSNFHHIANHYKFIVLDISTETAFVCWDGQGRFSSCQFLGQSKQFN